MKKLFLLIFFLLPLPVLGIFFTPQAHAAALFSLSDIIGTSRPSPSSPLSANGASGVTQVSIFDNGSRFLASDSAQIFRTSTGAYADASVNVASQSAALTTVYFGEATGALGQNGTDVLMVPITAMHKLQFTVPGGIPASGKVIITFPGSGSNTASPSATQFAFNGLNATGGLPSTIVTNNITCNTNSSVAAPTITCETTSAVSANTQITFLIGCSAQSGGNCSTAAPRMINPTKSAAAGTADTWLVAVETKDSANVTIDSGKTRIGTVDAVRVQATIDPTLTVTIAGLTSSDNNNTVGAGTCGSETSVNTGINATATTVSLGVLANGILSRSAQSITVSTNAANGYVITSTSSGSLRNFATGFAIADANGGVLTANDTPAPAVMASGTPAFGISPCGTRVSTSSPNWGASGNTATLTGTQARFSNPYNTGVNSYYATLASYTGGAVSSEVTVVRYGATIAGTTPAGEYITYFTYVVTPTF